VADVIRRCQSGKTTGSPATVSGNTTKLSDQGTEKNLSRFEEVSPYSSTEIVRKLRKPKKSPRQKATKVPDKNISTIPTQPHRTRPIQSKRSEDILCIDCGGLIPPARVEAIPNVQRCTKCQSLFESRDPSIFKRRVDEGLAGSRDDNKKMRARQWGDMQRRRRE
jgi:RNA polymerase-binding transcription factor DksA